MKRAPYILTVAVVMLPWAVIALVAHIVARLGG